MPVVYLGQNAINKEYVDSYEFNKMYLGANPLFIDGFNVDTILTNGLYLRYDTSNSTSYISGSGFMYNIAPSSSLSDVNFYVDSQITYTGSNQGALYLSGDINTDPIYWYNADATEVNTWMGMKSGATGNTVTHNIWLKPVTPGGSTVRQYIWRVGDQYGIVTNQNANELTLWYYSSGDNFVSLGSINPDVWNNIVITAERPNSNGAPTAFNAYVNGVLTGSASVSLSSGGAGEFVIGVGTGDDYYFKGYFSEYTFYNRVLSEGEARYNYQTQVARYQ